MTVQQILSNDYIRSFDHDHCLWKRIVYSNKPAEQSAHDAVSATVCGKLSDFS